MIKNRTNILEHYQKGYKNCKKLKKMNYVIDLLTHYNFKDMLSHNIYKVNGQNMCLYSWSLVYDISWIMFWRAKKLLEKGYWLSVIAPKYVPDAPLREHIEFFLREHFDLLAHWDPTGRKATIPEFSKKRFYENVFKRELDNYSLVCPSYEYFIKIWSLSFKHVRMTSKQTFSMCDKCQNWNQKIYNVSFEFLVYLEYYLERYLIVFRLRLRKT
jgi:hypothetical protein